jgi:hypothetical protein
MADSKIGVARLDRIPGTGTADNAAAGNATQNEGTVL